MPTVVSTPAAPAAIGPYAQAIVAGGTVYCSGQIAIDPKNGELVEGDVATQTRQVLSNLDAVLAAAGATRADVVRCTIFLTDMDDFSAVNEVYADFFGEVRPARATVAVAGLPKGVDVEIDAIAVLGG